MPDMPMPPMPTKWMGPSSRGSFIKDVSGPPGRQGALSAPPPGKPGIMRFADLAKSTAGRPPCIPNAAACNLAIPLADVMRLLQPVDWRRQALHPRLQLQRQILRIVPGLVEIAAVEPQGFLLGRLPHIAQLALPGAGV